MTIVHLKREEYTQYIGRPTIFGNPYPIGDDYTRAEAIEKYETYARENPKLLAAIKELDPESVLACWCSPRACHGDIIIKLWKELNAEILP